MTAVQETAAPAEHPSERTSIWSSRWLRFSAIAAIAMVLLTVTQEIADTDQLTDSGTWSRALVQAAPIMLAGLGGLWSERAGVINIGLEGMLILGTWFGAYGALEFGPWGGLALGILGGAGGGLIHAIATVRFGVDHIISGVAINLMAPGIARFLSDEFFSDLQGGGITQSPSIESSAEVSVPLIAGGLGGPDFLGWVEDKDWILLSDFCGIVRSLFADVGIFTLIAYALVPFTAYVLWRTRFGLRLRSCGEHPVAADSLGVNVYRYKFYAVLMSGALAGYGGAYLALETGLYRQSQTSGKGFIGLATMLFGNYRPSGTALGALLFGFADTLQLRDRSAAHALLVLIALGLAVGALYFLIRRRPVITLALVGVAGLFWWWFSSTDELPVGLPTVIPHISVLIVLVFAAKRIRLPAADGMQYRRGDQ